MKLVVDFSSEDNITWNISYGSSYHYNYKCTQILMSSLGSRAFLRGPNSANLVVVVLEPVTC